MDEGDIAGEVLRDEMHGGKGKEVEEGEKRGEKKGDRAGGQTCPKG